MFLLNSGQTGSNGNGGIHKGRKDISHFLSNFVVNLKWAPERHTSFPNMIKKRVLTYYLCLKVKKMKIPKYLNFEIVYLFVSGN